MSWFTDLLGSAGINAPDIDFLDKDTDPATRLAGALGGGALLAFGGLGQGSTKPTGYQGKIPEYEAIQQAVPQTYDPNRRPGSGGQRYFTNMRYAPRGEDNTGIRAEVATEAEGLAALNLANPAQQQRKRPTVGIPELKKEFTEDVTLPADRSQGLAAGGIATLKKGKYLDGATDGMADKVPANIDGVQEARLSDGEFVIPADVVSHLGNGNSDAGAKVLEDMMRRVRKARTGNTKQGKEIDPKKFIPA